MHMYSGSVSHCVQYTHVCMCICVYYYIYSVCVCSMCVCVCSVRIVCDVCMVRLWWECYYMYGVYMWCGYARVWGRACTVCIVVCVCVCVSVCRCSGNSGVCLCVLRVCVGVCSMCVRMVCVCVV